MKIVDYHPHCRRSYPVIPATIAPQYRKAGVRLTPVLAGEALARKCSGGTGPLEVLPGNGTPTAAGEGFSWTTPGGKPIRHPNAYKWPKVYHCSTNHVEVGRNWLRNHYAVLVGDTWCWPRPRTFHGVVVHGIAGGGSLCTGYGDPYHSNATGRAAAKQALEAWGRQKLADRQVARQRERLAAAWVSLSDSLKAGNCEPMSRSFAKEIGIPDDYVETVTVPGWWLLEKRDDSFTRRACAAALSVA